MVRETSPSRRKYLRMTAGMAALSLTGCVGGGDNGSNSAGGGNGSGDNGSGDDGNQSSGSGSGQTITIGSDIPSKPFEYRTNQDELVGFDVDLADAIFGEQLGMTPKFKTNSFDTIIPSLNNGNFKIIMSQMSITDERAKKVDFSDPYFTVYQTAIVLKNSDISSKEDLKGKTVGVQKGTTGETAAEELKKEFDGDLTIESYDQIPGTFSALTNNQVAAAINGQTSNGNFVDKNPDTVRFLEGEGAAAEQGKQAPPYLTLTLKNLGIAFRKDDDKLRKQVNEALATIKENGTYDKIHNEYFDNITKTTQG